MRLSVMLMVDKPKRNTVCYATPHRTWLSLKHLSLTGVYSDVPQEEDSAHAQRTTRRRQSG